jgi:hypothetical protein
MGDARLPESLRRRSDAEAVAEDLAPYRGTTVEERAAIMSRLCRFAAEQVNARPDGGRILAWQDRRSPESERLWLRLVAARRTR